MSDVTHKVRALVEAFATELADLVRTEAIATLAAAVGGTGSGSKRAPIGKNTGRALGRPKGGKRPPAELDALQDRLLAYIKGNAGQRIEQIGKGLGVPTKQLTLPARKLIAARNVSTKGQKRATTYWPARSRRTATKKIAKFAKRRTKSAARARKARARKLGSRSRVTATRSAEIVAQAAAPSSAEATNG